MNKIETSLVTGATGFIGRELVKELDLFNIKHRDFNRGDTDFGESVDVVYNLAAAGSKKGNYSRQEIFDTNIEQTWRLLEWSRKNARMFVHFSTSSVYGKQVRPMDIDMKLKPDFLYAATKAASEQLVREWSISTGKPAIVIRPFSIYGEGMQETKLIPVAIDRLKKGECVDLVHGEHDYLHVADLSRGVRLVTERIDEGYNELNFGSGEATTNEEVITIIAGILNVQPNYKYVDNLDGHVHFSVDSKVWVANNSLTNRYGWYPRIKFYDGIRKIIYG